MQNPSPYAAPQAAVVAAPNPEFPLSKTAIWLMCALLTPLVGAVLFYAWRRSNPVAATYANRASWACWGLWIAVAVLGAMAAGPGA